MKMTHVRNVFLTTTALAMGLCLAAPAQAQSTAPAEADADDAGGLAEIVVTARKANENLQTTPVAVTALGTEALESRQILQSFDLQRVAPGISARGAGTGPSSILTFAIRGNAQNSPNSASDSPVGIYVDGVYQGRAIASNLGILDLENVEVLRGTQGTLFGRNTTGGAVQFTTVQPGGELAGYVKAGIGNYKQRVVEGAITVPLQGDQFSVRLAGRYTEHGAYMINVPRNAPLGDLKSDVSARATVKWAPDSMPLTVTISGDYVNSKDSGTMSILKAFNPTGPLATLFPGQFSPTQVATNATYYKNYGNPHSGLSQIDTPFNRNEAGGVYGTVTYDLGDVALKSITAWRKSTSANALDLDSTPAEVIGFVSTYKQHQISEELQLSGKSGGFEWITGAYYFREAGSEQSDSAPLQFSPVLGGAGLAPTARSLADFTASSKALFAQANYQLSDRLRATGGFRYTWDNRSINRHGVRGLRGVPEVFLIFAPGPTPIVVQPLTCTVGVTAGTVSGNNCNDPKSAKFSYPAWTAGLDYKVTDNIFAYAKTGGAALAGGFNTRPTPAGLDAFSPEKVKDVELGLKTEFFDRHLRTNIAGFHVWRNGAQNIVNVFANGVLSQYVQNAGDVRSYGIEIEATLIPWQGMEITSGFATLHSKYAAGSFVTQGKGGLVDRSGETVSQAPRRTFNIGATQKFDAPWGGVSFHMDYAYLSSRAFGQDTPDLTDPALTAAQKATLVANYAIANKLTTLGGYGLFNMRITANLNNPNVELALWGRNLGRTKYSQNLFESYNALGFVSNNPGEPRTYGATVSFKF